MTQRTAIRHAKKPGEEGYVLLGAIILLALFVIAMAVAAPRVAKQIQRDREVETMHRGKQYIRAIQLYYRKFHAYPPNIEALEKTSEIRFLRKRYTDPMTGKDDWKPVYFGQNKTPMAMGFFGQPMGGTGGSVLAGTGPGGVGSTIGQPIGSSFNPSQPQTGTNTQQNSGSSTSGSGTPGNGSSGTGDSGGSSSGLGGDSGMTVAGAIIGVSPATSKQSILVYKTKNHYNEWEFLYSPLMDSPTVGGGNAGTIGTPVNGSGTQTNPNSGIGNSTGGTGNGSGSTTGSGSGTGGQQTPQ